MQERLLASRRELLGWAAGLAIAPATPALGHGFRPPPRAIQNTAPAPPIFLFETDGFWLNLHHFLYVLGRAQSEARDATRTAVVRAPRDQERGLGRLGEEARRTWQKAVTTYARTASQLDAVFDEKLSGATLALAPLRGADVPAGSSPEALQARVAGAVDANWLEALCAAAPHYEAAWWTEHSEANATFAREAEPLLQEYGSPVRSFVEESYGATWPDAGVPVQLSGYANWAGAYSTHGPLLVLSSLDMRLRGTLIGLETTFHEAMHQWDDTFFEQMVAAARAAGVRFPRGLSHAILFFTAGEAVRATATEHVPYAERFGIWERSSGRFLDAIRKGWAPYLRGDQRADPSARQAALETLMRELPPLPER